ncbi:class I SAM-dependent DNA methyltransferase [Acinetobacter sp. ANC 3813]|uniref:class I SAM-dependent DNA methyltransferase n=1 Tax=Acinetobacter sp. ANC 3813 TaxID=1977873 RepID=UPI000A346D5F|nr:class I SAM-dependent methyltransferase [Acinetobacter sp. ANC 3813]OTG90003.1 SAM-dependent methyltransferase [Acinetobacter sp. ANC 3813]
MDDQAHLAQNIIEIYKKHGRAWTALRGGHLYEKSWLDAFLAVLPQQAEILDLGCGSGRPIADYLIGHGHALTGVDSSGAMIEMAQHNFPNQVWHLADMRCVHLEQKFHGILAWDSFFHLTADDQRQMFQQFSKFSAKGTVLMFTSGPAEGEAIGDMFGEALYHASLSLEEYQALLSAHGFEVLKMIAEDADCTGHTVWLARKS